MEGRWARKTSFREGKRSKNKSLVMVNLMCNLAKGERGGSFKKLALGIQAFE